MCCLRCRLCTGVSILYWRCSTAGSRYSRGSAGRGFQFSIGDAYTHRPPRRRAGACARFNSLLEMLRVDVFCDVTYFKRLFQFSIGDARNCHGYVLEPQHLDMFQFSIGDAPAESRRPRQASALGCFNSLLEMRRPIRRRLRQEAELWFQFSIGDARGGPGNRTPATYCSNVSILYWRCARRLRLRP